MAPIKHFAAPPGLTTPPLSFATRAGDLLFVSGIPGFDENGTIPDSFEAQPVGRVSRRRNPPLDRGRTVDCTMPVRPASYPRCSAERNSRTTFRLARRTGAA